MFYIIDHRKNKNTPSWANLLLSHLRTWVQPVKFPFEDEETKPTIEGIFSACNNYLNELLQSDQRHFRRKPDLFLNPEYTKLQIFDSASNLILEVRKAVIYGYARVSTKKQSLKMQVEALQRFGCFKIIQEKVSALSERPLCDELLASLNKGDTFVIWKLDRLGRSMFDLIKIVADLDRKGVAFVSLTDNIDTSTTQGKMMLMLFSMMAEYELSIKKERQEAAKEIARQSGKLGGRPKGLSRAAKKTAKMLIDMYQERENGKYKYSIYEIIEALKISKGTLYNHLNLFDIPKRGFMGF